MPAQNRSRLEPGAVGFLLGKHVGVLAERKFRVAVPKLSGDPPQALPGGKGAGGIGMARAVEAERAHSF